MNGPLPGGALHIQLDGVCLDDLQSRGLSGETYLGGHSGHKWNKHGVIGVPDWKMKVIEYKIEFQVEIQNFIDSRVLKRAKMSSKRNGAILNKN